MLSDWEYTYLLHHFITSFCGIKDHGRQENSLNLTQAEHMESCSKTFHVNHLRKLKFLIRILLQDSMIYMKCQWHVSDIMSLLKCKGNYELWIEGLIIYIIKIIPSLKLYKMTRFGINNPCIWEVTFTSKAWSWRL